MNRTGGGEGVERVVEGGQRVKTSAIAAMANAAPAIHDPPSSAATGAAAAQNMMRTVRIMSMGDLSIGLKLRLDSRELAMPWTEARDFAEAVARIRREALLDAAVAARAAQADEKGWKAWVKKVSA